LCSEQQEGTANRWRVKHREHGPATSNPNVAEPLDVRWDDYDGLLARWVQTSRLIWINGAHPHVKQLVRDAVIG
jgi:hypothetical protein